MRRDGGSAAREPAAGGGPHAFAHVAPRAAPLTLGTAGHVDHGKTALVKALTGVDTDRLPEERERGLSIALGYAPLSLPSGRALSVVDVPGHERFVRTMVSGASGIDAYLMVVAADDGVMPQTLEHATVLRALGVGGGVIAVSKADIADPARALAESAELLPGVEAVACSARTGAGLDALRAALDRLAGRLEGRCGAADAPVRLHVDRAFTVPGRGTVATGTLWSGRIGEGETLELIGGTPSRRRPVRVRGVQVHDVAARFASAGQRVAVNLVGVKAGQTGRGDVLGSPGAITESSILDCALDLREARHGERVQVHHGTRDTPARLCDLGDGLWQLRLERPLAALDGDRVVVRRLAPPDTLGGGVVLDAGAPRHGRRVEALARLVRLREGERDVPPQPAPNLTAEEGAAPGPTLEAGAIEELEDRLLRAGPAMLSEAQMKDRLAELRVLREAGTAVRVSGRLYAHAEVAQEMRGRIVALIEREGGVSLAGARDALGVSRKIAQAFMEHLDSAHTTRRLPDDRRVLMRRAGETRQRER